MSISNYNPQQRDVVIFQRDDTNSYWGEAHISGSDLIFYIDSQGHINADNSASFYTLFPPSGGSSGGSGTTLVTGGLYPITTSWAISASWAPSQGGGSGTTLVTGGLYPITTSWAISASWAPSGGGSGTTLVTGGLYQITTSWAQNATNATNADSASIVFVRITASNANFYIPFVTTNSYQPIFIDPNSIYYNPGTDTLTVNNISASSVTASLFGTASWAVNAINGGTQLVTGSVYPITASSAISASHADQSNNAITAAFATNATHATLADTASYITSSNVFGTVNNATRAGTADTASYITSSNIVGFVQTSSVALNAQSASVAITASLSLSTISASYAITASNANTASFAFNSISSSFAINFNPNATASVATTASYAFTSSVATTASYAFTSSFMNATLVFISSSIQNNHYTYWTALSGSSQTFTLATASNLWDSGSFAFLQGTASWAQFVVTLPANVYFNTVTASAYAISQSIFVTQSNNYTISSSDDGRLVVVNSGSGVNVTVTTSSISPAFSAMYYQSGSGRITFLTASTSVFLRNRSGFTGSAGQYALVSLLRVPNGDFVLGGDVA